MNLILLDPAEVLAKTSDCEEESGASSSSSAAAAEQVVRERLEVVSLSFEDDRAKHIIYHLRKRTGDTVWVGIINGGKYIAEITIKEEQEEGVDTTTTTCCGGGGGGGGNDDDTNNAKKKKRKKNNNEKRQNNKKKGILKLTLCSNSNNDNKPTNNDSTTLSNDNNNTTKKLPLLLQQPLPQPHITLILALPFPARMKYLWSVIASMGVQRIIIFVANLSNPEHIKSKSLLPATYNPLIREGLSQGGHTTWPEVIVDINVDVLVEQPPAEDEGGGGDETDENNNGITLEKLNQYCTSCGGGNSSQQATAKIFLDCGDETTIPPTVQTVIQNQLLTATSTTTATNATTTTTTPPVLPAPALSPSAIIAIGPERGWTNHEAKIFSQGGFQSAILGSSILRVDTAVVAGIAQVQQTLVQIQQQQKQQQQ